MEKDQIATPGPNEMMTGNGSFLQRFSFLLLWVFLWGGVPEAWAETTHRVKKGESLSSIARVYRVPISKIREANDLEDTRLQIGQSLAIPKLQPAASSPSSLRKGNRPNECRGEDIPHTHRVKSGDTLARIAKRYQLTVEELQELNDLKGTRLQIGQVLHLNREEGVCEEAQKHGGEGIRQSALTPGDGTAIPFRQSADTGEKKDLNSLVTVAESFLGVRYRRGGTSVKTGLDCSAYVQKVFRMVGTDLPRTAREQFGVGMEVAREALGLGDLVFFKRSRAIRPAHVGIYIGNDQFIHSSTTQRKIRVDSLNSRYFSGRFIGARRIQAVEVQPELPSPEVDSSPASKFDPEPIQGYLLFSETAQAPPPFHPEL